MAKIKKIIEDGGIQYPATITDAVKNPNNGKTVTEELSELGSKVGRIIGFSGYDSKQVIFTQNSVSFASDIFRIDSNGLNRTWNVAGHTYVFDENSYLVINSKDLTKAKIVVGSVNLEEGDIILLYYRTDVGFFGGEFYPNYLDFTKGKGVRVCYPVDATYTDSSITFSRLSYNDGGDTKTIYVNDEKSLTTFEFGEGGHLVLVLSNGEIRTRKTSAEVIQDDVILFQYSSSLGKFVGGLFFENYLKSVLEANVDAVNYNAANIIRYIGFTTEILNNKTVAFTKNSVTFQNNIFYVDVLKRRFEFKLKDQTYNFSVGAFLVVNSKQRDSARIVVGLNNLQDGDIILLVYNAFNGFVGGLLYELYLHNQIPKNIASVYSRNISFEANTCKLTSLYVIGSEGGPSVSVFADPVTEEEVIYTFDGLTRYLVLNNGEIATRDKSSSVRADDFILLVYDTNNGSFVDGALFPLYLSLTRNIDVEIKETRDKPDNLGVYNAIRKAHQMTDVSWTAVAPLDYNSGSFATGSQYTGVIYSSVKELNQFVNEDISMHTYMTALHNPRSIIYKEKANESPLHGQNCRAYYGTVCSGLVGYAMGVKTNMRTYDFVVADFMEKVQGQDVYNLKLGDFLWRPGHTAIVTDIYRDSLGRPTRIEVSEAAGATCKRYFISGEEMQSLIQSSVDSQRWEFYRNKNISSNLEYKPLTEFVAVEGERLTPFAYNDDIMSYRGDKSLYVNGENVKLLIREDYADSGYASIEIYKDSALLETKKITSSEIILEGYQYGAYKACLVKTDNTRSDFTYWKIIDVNVSIDRTNSRVYFSSRNSMPLSFEFCNVAGFRSEEYKEDTIKLLSDSEINQGYVEVSAPSTTPDSDGRTFTYVKVHFQDEYGRVINKPLEWFA